MTAQQYFDFRIFMRRKGWHSLIAAAILIVLVAIVVMHAR